MDIKKKEYTFSTFTARVKNSFKFPSGTKNSRWLHDMFKCVARHYLFSEVSIMQYKQVLKLLCIVATLSFLGV